LNSNGNSFFIPRADLVTLPETYTSDKEFQSVLFEMDKEALLSAADYQVNGGDKPLKSKVIPLVLSP